jgi:formamidase
MAVVEVRIDRGQSLTEDGRTGHNRWHPDIAPITVCAPGDTVVLDTRDAADGQITSDSTDSDLAHLDLGLVHPLTGPVRVDGAEPGDLLELEIEQIEPGAFGYTAITPGFGFLRDLFADPMLVRWCLQDGAAVSDQLPGVRIPGDPFLGIIGVAPDQRLLATSRQRESDAVDRGDFAAPPTDAARCVPTGTPGRDGLRTGPPRENGGNLDIRQLGRGARVFLPVFVEGALFSVGDAHFAQGDGEVCGLAIEMCSTVRLRVGLDRGGARRRHITQTCFTYRDRPGAAGSGGREYFVTTGLSVEQAGGSLSENTTAAARNALLDMIEYLVQRGLSRQQAYVLCSVAVDLRISQIVDVPHATVSAFLPLDIFT